MTPSATSRRSPWWRSNPLLFVVNAKARRPSRCRIRRARQDQSGQVQLRLARRGDPDPPGGRAVQPGSPAFNSSTFPIAAARRPSWRWWQTTRISRSSRPARRCRRSRPAALRAIAAGSLAREPQLPDLPTVAEQGFPGLRGDPVGRPADHRRHAARQSSTRLNAEVNSALQRSRRDRQARRAGSYRQAAAARTISAKLIASEIRNWTDVAARRSIKAE